MRRRAKKPAPTPRAPTQSERGGACATLPSRIVLRWPGQYDVTPDDQRFVMIRNRGAEEENELIVVENFFEELKAKVGN